MGQGERRSWMLPSTCWNRAQKQVSKLELRMENRQAGRQSADSNESKEQENGGGAKYRQNSNRIIH